MSSSLLLALIVCLSVAIYENEKEKDKSEMYLQLSWIRSNVLDRTITSGNCLN